MVRLVAAGVLLGAGCGLVVAGATLYDWPLGIVAAGGACFLAARFVIGGASAGR